MIPHRPRLPSFDKSLKYSIEDGRILVVSGIADVNIPRSEWFEQGNRAVYFAIEDDTIVELNGEQVDVGLIARGQKVDDYHCQILINFYMTSIIFLNPGFPPGDKPGNAAFVYQVFVPEFLLQQRLFPFYNVNVICYGKI